MGGRIYSIDSMRIVAMAFIVMIHTDPFRGVGAYGNVVNFVIDTSARFAVPFFFVTAGYFFALKIAERDPTRYLARRIATISSFYVFGLLLSVPVFLTRTAVRASVDGESLVSNVAARSVEFVSPLELVYYGDSVSEILWFLPALAFSLALIYVFVEVGADGYVLPVALVLHVVGLLGTSYTMFVDVAFPTRDALFFGFFYTGLGYHIYSSGWQPRADRSARYLSATLLFGALHLGERYVLGYVLTGETFQQGVYTASYTITTALLTIGLFAFLLSKPNLGNATPLPAWGHYAVGIYVVHPAVLSALNGLGNALDAAGYDATGSIPWHLALTPATFFGALLVYLGAYRVGVLEIGEAPSLRPDRF
ncbi:acyltransferase [Halalkalicoccus subterraneus]|uniref:acyltransferase n=1 Tax=Halalkalicoccus subterraneus TaxID=2675002 RepID=UPI000EFA3BC0|nr:acyltransferase [Halalkalicoccus subterraneus]